MKVKITKLSRISSPSIHAGRTNIGRTINDGGTARHVSISFLVQECKDHNYRSDTSLLFVRYFHLTSSFTVTSLLLI